MLAVALVGADGARPDDARAGTSRTAPETTAAEEPATTEAETTVTTAEAPTATTAAATTEAAPTTADLAVDLLALVVGACRAIDEAQSDLFNVFIEDGPGESAAALLEPIIDIYAGLDVELATVGDRPGAAEMREAVRLYQLVNDGLRVLYREGETAYQLVPPARQEFPVRDQAAAAWDEGAALLFGGDAPPAPSDSDEC